MTKLDRVKHQKSLLLIILFIITSPIFILSFLFLEAQYFKKHTQPNQDYLYVYRETEAKQSQINNISVPILMFHHIRNFSDQNDQAGIILSVDPIRLAQALDYIKDNGYNPINFYDIASNQIPDKPIILTFDDGYDDFYNWAYPEIKKRGMTGVVYVITNRIDQDGYLKRSQIIEISQNDIEIGSHTQSHPNLLSLNDQQIKNEITSSKTELESIINKKIVSFSYPTGKYNQDIASKVANADYLFAVTTDNGKANTGNPFTLKRYRINHSSNIEHFVVK